MYQYLKKLVDICANWFEAIGFILTIITAIKVFIINQNLLSFNKKHLFQVRSTEHIKRLKDIAGKISVDLADFENKRIEIREQVKKAEEIAKSIVRKVLSKDADILKKIIKEGKRIQNLPDSIEKLSSIKRIYFRIYGNPEFNEEIVGQYYIELTGLITYLEELKKDDEKSLML